MGQARPLEGRPREPLPFERRQASRWTFQLVKWKRSVHILHGDGEALSDAKWSVSIRSLMREACFGRSSPASRGITGSSAMRWHCHSMMVGSALAP